MTDETRYVTKIFDPGERQEAAVTITPERTATYKVVLDWANDGNFTGTYDDVTNDVMGSGGIAIERGRDQQRANGSAMVPAASWTLNNANGTYNPQRGPLSSLMIPGRQVAIQATFGSTATTMGSQYATMQDAGLFTSGVSTVPLFRGSVESFGVNPALGSRTVEIRALGKLAKLRGRIVSTPLYNAITTGTAMQYLMQAAGLTASEYVIDPYAISSGSFMNWWIANEVDAYDAAVELLETEGPPGALYEDGLGRIVFESRQYRKLATRSTTPQAWFRDTDSDGFYLTYGDISFEPGLQNVANDVTLTVQVLNPTIDETVIWTYGNTDNPFILDASGYGSVIARPEYPFYGAITPSLAGGDFTLNRGSVTSVSLSVTSGGSTTISVVGTPSGSINGLRLRGKMLTPNTTVGIRNQVTTTITTSQATFGVRSTTPKNYPHLRQNDAQVLADQTVQNYALLRPVANITFWNINNAHMVQALSREVGDRVHLISSSLGIDDDYWIEQITHEIKEAGTHTVTLGLEKVPLISKVGQWLAAGGTTSVWGTDGTTANVGFWG